MAASQDERADKRMVTCTTSRPERIHLLQSKRQNPYIAVSIKMLVLHIPILAFLHSVSKEAATGTHQAKPNTMEEEDGAILRCIPAHSWQRQLLRPVPQLQQHMTFKSCCRTIWMLFAHSPAREERSQGAGNCMSWAEDVSAHLEVEPGLQEEAAQGLGSLGGWKGGRASQPDRRGPLWAARLARRAGARTGA